MQEETCLLCLHQSSLLKPIIGFRHFVLLQVVPQKLNRTAPYLEECMKIAGLDCGYEVLMLHEQSARFLPFLATTSLAQFPTSVLQLEQRDEGRSFLHITRQEKSCQVILEKTREESESSAHEEDISYSYERLKDLEHRILKLSALWYLSPSLQYGDLTSFSMLSGFSKTKRLVDVESHDAVTLAKKALSASKQAALFADDLRSFGTEAHEFRTEVDEFQTPSSTSTSFSIFPLEEMIIVRSTRQLERRSKKRMGSNPEVMVQETRNLPRAKSRRKTSKPFEPDNPFRMFLRGAEKTKLLTVEEETELFTQIQGLKRLEEVKSRLRSEVDREPTMVEWASAAGLSCQALKWQLHCGNSSRERLIYANFRMVVHIAKKYCGRGLKLEDLLQVVPQKLNRTAPYLEECMKIAGLDCGYEVLMLHEQSARFLPFLATTSLAQFPTSVLQLEQRDEGRSFLHITRQEKSCQVILEKTREESESSAHEEDISYSYERLKDLEHRILKLSALWYLSPSLQYGDLTSFSMLSGFSKTKRLVDVESHDAVTLAKKALSASKQAALFADDLRSFGTEAHEFRTEVDEFQTPSSTSTSFSIFPLEEMIIVRSTRQLERRSKKRMGSNPEVMVQETRNLPRAKSRRKTSKPFEPDNPFRMFLRGAEKTKLLTVEEETELFTQIQGLKRLEEVKSRLRSEVDREPTMVEWASAAGLSCQALKWQLHCGNSSRERLIYANFRMVVHIAKKYCGRGLKLEDLLQEGSGGLMRCVEKFNLRPGCRFASYAYFWIKQAIRKAIFQHSRTIPIPESAYILLYKVMDAKRLCIEDGIHQPTKEDIATRVGMTVEKLQSFLFSVRKPVSIDQPIWTDQDTTYQEITADPAFETPDVSMDKYFMKQHLCYLLSTLTPREQTILRMRFGLEGSNIKSLSEIGAGFGICKERVRQLERKALSKLKRRLSSQDQGAYAELLR